MKYLINTALLPLSKETQKPPFLARILTHVGFCTFSEVETTKLARTVFSKLHDVCSSWVKDFPLQRKPHRYYETSIHAIKNMRRKMEDKHVCIPDFNTLFNLEVKSLLRGRENCQWPARIGQITFQAGVPRIFFNT